MASLDELQKSLTSIDKRIADLNEDYQGDIQRLADDKAKLEQEIAELSDKRASVDAKHQEKLDEINASRQDILDAIAELS